MEEGSEQEETLLSPPEAWYSEIVGSENMFEKNNVVKSERVMTFYIFICP